MLRWPRGLDLRTQLTDGVSGLVGLIGPTPLFIGILNPNHPQTGSEVKGGSSKQLLDCMELSTATISNASFFSVHVYTHALSEQPSPAFEKLPCRDLLTIKNSAALEAFTGAVQGDAEF